MAILSFANFKRQIQGASFQSEPQLIRGKSDGGFISDSKIDPNRIPGVLSPFPLGSSLTNSSSIDTEIVKMINFINTNAYIYAAGGSKIYEITTNNDTVTTGAPYPHTINHSHSGETVSDMIAYENNGTINIFYSFNDGTDGDIGRLSGIQSADTFDDSYYSGLAGGGTLNKDVPHPLAVANNNILYIGNGSILASMDLSTGTPTATQTEIDLLGGWVIKDHISYKGFHWIAARETHDGADPDSRQVGRIGIFVWDYTSSTFDQIYFIDDTDIFNIFVHEGILHVATAQARSNAKIRRFSGVTFVPIILYKPSGETREQVTLGGVSERHGMILWGSNVNGEIYTLGNPQQQNNNDFNTIGDVGIKCTSIIQKSFDADTYYIANDSPAVVKYIFNSSGGFKTDTATMLSLKHDFQQNVTIQEFRVYFPNLGTGIATNKLQLDGYFNGSSGNTILGTIGSDKTSVGYFSIPYQKKDVYSINIGFRYTGNNVALGDTTILPYKIDIVYEPTSKK